jgi:predicted peroxiredoxin
VTNDRRTLVFLTRPDGTAVRMAGSCALAAAAMGDRVDVFLLGEAVRVVVEAAGERAGERAGDGAGEPDDDAAALFQARSAGTCRIFACSQGVVESGLDPAAVQAVLDAVVGWPTILEWTRGVADRFFF